MSTNYGYGFKILDPTGCTYYKGNTFQYNLPQRGQKWALTEHPEPAEKKDGLGCGPGRIHIHNRLSYACAPNRAWPWFARYSDRYVVGRSGEKTAVSRVELRRIDPRTLARSLRPPFNWGRNTNLIGANLRGANLCVADLSRADLRDANLRDANLREATYNKLTLLPPDCDTDAMVKV